jgi:hypothetical protein
MCSDMASNNQSNDATSLSTVTSSKDTASTATSVESSSGEAQLSREKPQQPAMPPLHQESTTAITDAGPSSVEEEPKDHAPLGETSDYAASTEESIIEAEDVFSLFRATLRALTL